MPSQDKVKVLCIARGVHGHFGKGSTISGYQGHSWDKYVDAASVVIDKRTCQEDRMCGLVISGPMLEVDLPDSSMSKPMAGGFEPYDRERSGCLDYVSLDVYLRLWTDAGATVYRGQDAVDFIAKGLLAK